MPGTIINELGTITITEDSIALMAGYATIENAGVVGMAARSAKEGFWELLKRENARKGVHVLINEDNTLTLDIYIMVEYGVSICAVASNVKDNVTYKLKTFMGFEVKAVNVHVEGVRVQAD